MLTLRADNRVLTNGSKFSYLIDNYQAAVSDAEVANIEPFSVASPILIGEMGQANTEILKVLSISGTTISFGTAQNAATTTFYPHSESTRVTVLQFDQIRFFWTAATGTIADENPTFSDSDPLTDWTTLDPSSFYSTYSDPDHSTGFGWFMYRNALTGETSQESNPIPYVGFNLNTAQQVFLDFESSLNTNELKLITMNDKFSWLNEGLAVIKNKLNLTNVEYTVSSPQTLTTVSGQSEYILPDDFSEIVEIVDGSGYPIDFTPVSQTMTRNGLNPTSTNYYLRGRYLGLTPTPGSTGTTYSYTYRAKASRVTSLSTYIDLPDNAFYSIKDWMMYRACLKFNNPLATAYYQSFKNSTDLYIQAAVKRNANLDTWDISPHANA